jgi:hypothetical protein
MALKIDESILTEVDDSDISEQAVNALNAATQRAIASGKRVVLVADGKLIAIEGEKRTILGDAPPKIKVAKQAKWIGP